MQHGWYSDPRELHFRRELIREVRVDRGDGLNALAGAGIGEAIGAGIGATGPRADRGAAAFLFGVIGASIGTRRDQLSRAEKQVALPSSIRKEGSQEHEPGNDSPGDFG
jgi:hypothetical protein